jgi:hypothetical protein
MTPRPARRRQAVDDDGLPIEWGDAEQVPDLTIDGLPDLCELWQTRAQ